MLQNVFRSRCYQWGTPHRPLEQSNGSVESLEKINKDHSLVHKILDKRGTSYERLGDWKNAEKDLKESLQILQTWFSPSFPIGSYSFSHGLEAMIEDKLIVNKKD